MPNMKMNGCPWTQYTPDPMPFCEEQLCALVREPSNSWTNIGYFIIAWLLLGKTELGPTRRFFAAAAVTLGMGSSLFHITSTLWGKYLDLAGMISLSSLFLNLAIKRYFNLSLKMFAYLYVAITVLSWPLIGYGRSGSYIFFSQCAVALILEFQRARRVSPLPQNLKMLKLAVIVFPILLVLNILDQQRILCWPSNHVLTIHGVWHLGSAYCIYLASFFFCREEERGD